MKNYKNKVSDPLDLLTADNLKSFRGIYSTVLLEAGDLVFRFCRHHEAKYSDYWTDKETLKLIFQSYQDRNRMHPFGNKKAQIKTQTFEMLAIAKKWSNLEYILAVEIRKNLIAYKGLVAEQSFFQTKDMQSELRKVIMSGGGMQLVIPRIKNYAENNNLIEIHRLVNDVEFIAFTDSSWYKRLVTAGHVL